MSARLVLPAPAKLNLFLHIIGRREDGYHLLQSVFQFLDYGDEISFEANDRGELSLTSNIPELDNSDNLIIKAAKLLQQKSSGSSNSFHKSGASIRLTKRLPMGGGVGGGSSNAATTLLALNALWNLGLSMDELAGIGLQLGADVPVFVRGFSAFAEGVGEILQPVKPKECWYLVLVPDAHVDTTRMYKHRDLTRDTPPIKVCAAFDLFGSSIDSSIKSQERRNDFEPLVRRLYPEVDNCLTLLDNFAGAAFPEGKSPGSESPGSSGKAMMSGSGACVFAPFDSREQAQAAQSKLHSSGINSFVAQGVNCSPLHTALQNAGYSIPE